MTLETIEEILSDILDAVLNDEACDHHVRDLAAAIGNPTLAYALLAKYREVKYLEDRVRECATPDYFRHVVRIDDLIAAMKAKRQL